MNVGEAFIAKFWIRAHSEIGSVTYEHWDKVSKGISTEFLTFQKEVPKQYRAIDFTWKISQKKLSYSVLH